MGCGLEFEAGTALVPACRPGRPLIEIQIDYLVVAIMYPGIDGK